MLRSMQVGLEDRELSAEVGKAVLPYMADLDPEEIATFGFSYAKSDQHPTPPRGSPQPHLALTKLNCGARR